MNPPYLRDPNRLSIPRNWYTNRAAKMVSPVFWKGIACSMLLKTLLRFLDTFHEIFVNNAIDAKRKHTALDTGAPPARHNDRCKTSSGNDIIQRYVLNPDGPKDIL